MPPNLAAMPAPVGIASSHVTFASALADENIAIVAIGAAVGLAFGAFAQQSRFCLRSATVEFWRRRPGEAFAVWLLAFSAALLATQAQFAAGWLDPADIRQLSTAGSMSGALIGGLLFGAGMILARGCASRLLVLSATGNLRALVTGLLLTLVAQASLTGALSPLRLALSETWPIGPAARDLANFAPREAWIAGAATMLAVSLYAARLAGLSRWRAVAAIGVGGAVAGGWFLTAWQAGRSFALVPVESVSFTGPSADTLLALVNTPSLPATFDTGLVPGVFAGSLLAALATRQFHLQTFNAESGMIRYLVGAALMGFGGMLAGGCAVGAGMTGGSALAITAWVALAAMWFGAGATDALVDRASGQSDASLLPR